MARGRVGWSGTGSHMADTPASTPVSIHIPDELEFDTSKPFTCRGILELLEELPCTGEGKKVVEIRLTRDWSDNADA